jgi:drug/metabolite transporter (DMT)-like permease
MARGTVSCAILIGGLAILRRDLLRVRRHDVPYFAVMGFVTVTVVFTLYAYAVALVGVSVASVLQYTAPAFVTIIAWRAFHESLDRVKMLALALALAGVALIAHIYNPAGVIINPTGVLCGMASGLCFGLYSVFSKRAVKMYNPWTVITYNMTFGMFFLALFQMPAAITAVAAAPGAIPWIIAMAIGPTVLAHGLYLNGLVHVPASNASIISTWEPMTATILAFAILGETLDGPQLLGAAAIILGVILLSRKST